MTSSPGLKPPAGPPWSVTDDDDRRQQTPATVLVGPPYIMCRQASNNIASITWTGSVFHMAVQWHFSGMVETFITIYVRFPRDSVYWILLKLFSLWLGVRWFY